MVYAHRWAWENVRGAIPEGTEVLHECDTPLCVRPTHLRIGTHAENLRDMMRRGRGRGQFKPNKRWAAEHELDLAAR
jgi:hypothetical protein